MPNAVQDEETAAVAAVVAEADRLQDDADGFAALLTEDAAIVNFVGRRVTGRDAIHEAMRAALASSLAQVRTRTELSDVNFPAPGVALASCVKHVSDEREGAAPLAASSGRMTFVLVQQDGRWRIALAQTTPIAA